MGLVIAIVILVLIVGAVLWLVSGYNRLVRGRNAYKNAFAQIDVQLQRRFDLIPNLVETAKAYMQYEKSTLEAVVQARGAAMAGLSNARGNLNDQAAMTQLAQSEGALNGALGRLFAITEAYPELKANQNMMQLSEELTSTENKVAFARQAYNDSVMLYNNQRETFPTSAYAGMFHFQPAALLEIPQDRPDMREAPKVSFDPSGAPTQSNPGTSLPPAQSAQPAQLPQQPAPQQAAPQQSDPWSMGNQPPPPQQ
jgi:LemA protein